MKVRFYILLICFIFATGLIEILALRARPNQSLKAGFSRLMVHESLLSAKWINLQNNSYYFAGVSSKSFYLGNYTAPLRLFKCDFELKDTQTLFLCPTKGVRMDWFASRIEVDSPEIYVMEGNTPMIIKKREQNRGFTEELKYKMHFTKSVAVSSHSFILRTYDGRAHQNILARVSTNRPTLKYSNSSLNKQVDGFFCTDGQLIFDKASHRLFYLYYYRNKIVSFDTNLERLPSITTIDTNTVAKIQVDSVPGQNLSTLLSTNSNINKMASIHDKHILVWSLVRADNNDKKQFETNAVFDSYSITNGKYEGSFYIPPFRNLKPSGFFFTKRKIFGLYQNYLVSYETENPILKD